MLPFISSELKVIIAVYGALTLRLLFLSLFHLPGVRGGRYHYSSFIRIPRLREGRCPEQGHLASKCWEQTPPQAWLTVLWPWAERFLTIYPLILRNWGWLNRQNQSIKSGRGWERVEAKSGEPRPGWSELIRLWGLHSTSQPSLLTSVPCTLQPNLLLHVHRLLSTYIWAGCYLGTAQRLCTNKKTILNKPHYEH